MFKKNKKIIIFLVIVGFTCFFVAPVLAVDYGFQATGGAAGLKAGDPSSIIGNLIGALLSLIGVLFLALMLFGGVTWMLARGNQEMEKKALDTIMGAVIGIIIVVASYAITNFVLLGAQGKTTSTSGTDQCKEYNSEWRCQGLAACGLDNYVGLSPTGTNWIKEKCSGGEETICCKAIDNNEPPVDPDAECWRQKSYPPNFAGFCTSKCVFEDGACGNDDAFTGALCSKYCYVFGNSCEALDDDPGVECQKLGTPDACNSMKEATGGACEWI